MTPPDHHQSSYLEHLQFDPQLNHGWVAAFISNLRIVLLIVITIVLVGIISYFNLPKRLNPEIKIPIVSVITVLPGAGPEDIESLITIPLENKVQGLTGVDTISSVSQPNISAITLQFTSNTDSEKAKNDVQSAVESVSDLPEDALDSQVAAFDFENQPIWQFAITHENNDLPSLMRFADNLKNELEDEPKIDRVEVNGFESQEIVIHASPEKVTQYGLNPLLLTTAVKNAVLSYPSGNARTDRNTFSLTIDPTVTTVEDIRNLRLTVEGVQVKLGDIAEVFERSTPDNRQAYLASDTEEPKRIITMNVYKLQTAKIDETQHIAQTIADETIQKYDNRFSLVSISNTAEMVTEQFTDLLGEFRTTMLLVFACLLVFLGLRQALISSLTVPLTFLSAFALMSILGMSINFLSLFAFLLALGLLIDDTIVVISAMTAYYKTGKFTPHETGLLVWRDTIVPIWSTTITTIWSFIPLLLSSGIIGEFIKPIPIVITVTMISSTAIAVFITLPFMMVILKPHVAHRVVVLLRIIAFVALLGGLLFVTWGNPLLPFILVLFVLLVLVFLRVRDTLRLFTIHQSNRLAPIRSIKDFFTRYNNRGILDIEVLSEKYYGLIIRVLNSARARKQVLIAIIAYSIVGFLLVPLGLVKNEFFPKVDAEQLYVNLELPPGTDKSITSSETLRLIEELRHTAHTDFVIAEMGQQISAMGATGGGDHVALFTIHLPPEHDRPMSSIELAEDLRQKYKYYDQGTIQVVEQSGGPPAGADVQIQLYGDDLGELNRLADEAVAFLKTQTGLANIQKSIKPGTSALVFEPDLSKLASYGIDTQTLGLWLRSFSSGFTLDEVNFTNLPTDDRNVVFRFGKGTPSVESLGSLTIPTRTESIPLTSLGNVKLKTNPTTITREDGKRTVTISAAITPGFSAPEKNQALINFVEALEKPAGYGYKTGGVNEENQKSVNSILQAMVVAAILILVTMVIQFHSYRQAFIVLIVIPLAVSSVFYLFALTGTPLSFPALIGVLSLFGIVVTNSMFIVDKINLNQKEGMPFKESIADAGASRLEPIILTKLCTVLGLLPITIADPLWRGLGGAIIFGLLLASSIMLLFIPVLYYQWFKTDK